MATTKKITKTLEIFTKFLLIFKLTWGQVPSGPKDDKSYSNESHFLRECKLSSAPEHVAVVTPQEAGDELSAA